MRAMLLSYIFDTKWVTHVCSVKKGVEKIEETQDEMTLHQIVLQSLVHEMIPLKNIRGKNSAGMLSGKWKKTRVFYGIIDQLKAWKFT